MSFLVSKLGLVSLRCMRLMQIKLARLRAGNASTRHTTQYLALDLLILHRTNTLQWFWSKQIDPPNIWMA